VTGRTPVNRSFPVNALRTAHERFITAPVTAAECRRPG